MDHARSGDVRSTAAFALTTGALWAIGSSWALTIRNVVMLIVPRDDTSALLQIGGEVGSSVLITVFGIIIAVFATHLCASQSRQRNDSGADMLHSPSTIHGDKRESASRTRRIARTIGKV